MLLTRHRLCKKSEIIFLVLSMLRWYECWYHWQKCPILYNGPNCCHGNMRHIHSVTPIVQIFYRDIYVWSTHLCVKYQPNRARIDNFGKLTLSNKFSTSSAWKGHWAKVKCDIAIWQWVDLNTFWCLSEVYDDWFKSYAHFYENWVCIFCDLDLDSIFTKYIGCHAAN
jgi:hypothetical protein